MGILFVMCDIDFCDFCNWGLSQFLTNTEKTWLSLLTRFTLVLVSLDPESMVKMPN